MIVENRWQRHELMYCGNVHPCTSVEELIAQVEMHLLPIKKARNLTRMHLGVWLNLSLLKQLMSQSTLRTVWFNLLSEHNLTIKSLNAFPQEEFHGKTIKSRVYFPEWWQESRLDYTILLADFIAQYPAVFEQKISISTVPLGYKASWNQDKQKLAVSNLNSIATHLAKIKKENAIHIRLCLEMEPDCQLELTEEVIYFFKNELNISTKTSNAEHLGVCYDVCHQAVMFEDTVESIVAIEDSDIVIGKIQISNAMSFTIEDKEQVQSSLRSYDNSPYLHQTHLKTNSTIISFPDLDFSLLNDFNLQDQVRIHFHVPVNLLQITPILKTTQHAISEVINLLSGMKKKPDLEIETYTWLLMTTKLSLNEKIYNEIKWLEQALIKQNLIIE